MKNECVECKEQWKVKMDHHVKLDEIDYDNISKHGQLYSVCEDCSESGECESVEVEIEGNKMIVSM